MKASRRSFLKGGVATKAIPILWMVGLFSVAICASSWAQVGIEVAFPRLSFIRPVDLQHPDDGTNRLFVVEQRGVISVFENDPQVSTKKIFLDIQDRVRDQGNEEGLLGVAFHPDYEENGYFYVDYTASNPRRTVVARYTVSQTTPDAADKNSEQVVLEIEQPFSNHNGGQLRFGPDGYLYVGMGDGGSGGDPFGNGQNLETLLGALLRIDVDTSAGGQNYGIPPDNPFAGNGSGYREEVYAYGLRNPWRFSFDPVTQRLWLADVGQDAYEEIDLIEAGKNYGWNTMEGLHCFNPRVDCDMTGLELPIWEYDHSLGQSITGGFVYRGGRAPELRGAYIYADFVSGRIWALRYDDANPPENTELIDTSLGIAGFGTDRQNELYLCAFDGKIYRFQSSEKPAAPWDVNADGVVDVSDLVLVGSQFGQQGADLSGDVNGDGAVNLFDLVLVGSHFGEEAVPAAPSALRSLPSDRQRIRRALAELEGLVPRPRGAEVAIESLRAWLEDAQPVVTATKLFENYPNPFNPETWMPYQLATDSEVTVRIYDLRGRLIRQLFLGRQPAGLYLSRDRAAHWDGRDERGERVSSGLYLYQLSAGSFSAVKRMEILK